MNTKPNINFIQTAVNRKSLHNQNLIHILMNNLTKKEVRQTPNIKKNNCSTKHADFSLAIFLNCSFTISSNYLRRPQNNVCLTLGKLKFMKVLISHNGSELKYPILYTIFLD